jgi:DNA (cytosine-5)-methyltransferase 1
MAAYYNEIDPFTAAWLRELIKAGLIADGEVDERSITDVQPGDLRGFTQCHFFAGIGGWSYALRLAGWPDDRHVWTGSCPCQPFSSAGRGDGENDPRDLWPAWFRLVVERLPHPIFGEQVADAARNGWFDRLCADMEGANYAIGACVLGAHSVGAPHIRQRLYFVAHSESDRLEKQRLSEEGRQVVADTTWRRGLRENSVRVADAAFECQREQADETDAIAASGQAWSVVSSSGEPLADAHGESEIGTAIARAERDPWCVEPALGRVVNGIPHKVVEPFLRGYGNAIVPQVAAAFIEAYVDARNELTA